MTAWIALLRGINVGGRNKLPMAELRSLCGGLGWANVQTYIQSGNVVFQTKVEAGAATGSEAAGTAQLEIALEQAIADRFGFDIPVIVRSGAEWQRSGAGNPFPDESEHSPNHVLLALSKEPPRADAVAELRSRAGAGELIERVGDALWIYYAGGVARSKLTPALLDRGVGSPVTTRNWRTVNKMSEMLEALENAKTDRQ